MLTKLPLAAALSALLSIPALAGNNQFKTDIDEIFADVDQANAPGCNIGVIKDGKLIHKAGYGLANLELGVPLDGNNVHRIASVSKQFTAMAVLLLAEEGKINLEDDIREHLPELKNYGTKITINAMLGHFSGMADYDFISSDNDVKQGANLESVAGGDFRLGNEDYLSIEEFYDVVKTVGLRHEPNTRWAYSNLAYFLLSMLVEEVSGESLREYADKRMFKPLGMNNTFFSDEPTEVVRHRASGYRPNDNGGYQTDMTNLFWVGDGGLHTNVEDMAKWDQNFYAPKVGKNPQALLALFNTPNSEFEARDGLYANGQMIGEVHGQTAFMHGGGWLGVRTFYGRIPSEQFSTIVLCNDTSQNPSRIAEQIADVYFEHNEKASD